MNIKILYYSTVYNELIKNFENTNKNYLNLNFNDHTDELIEFSGDKNLVINIISMRLDMM